MATRGDSALCGMNTEGDVAQQVFEGMGKKLLKTGKQGGDGRKQTVKHFDKRSPRHENFAHPLRRLVRGGDYCGQMYHKYHKCWALPPRFRSSSAPAAPGPGAKASRPGAERRAAKPPAPAQKDECGATTIMPCNHESTSSAQAAMLKRSRFRGLSKGWPPPTGAAGCAHRPLPAAPADTRWPPSASAIKWKRTSRHLSVGKRCS